MRPNAGSGAPATSASLTRRAVALLVDAFVSLAWVLPLTEIERRPGYLRLGLEGWRFALAIVIGIAYFAVLEATAGATIGKLVTGIRVEREEGGRPGWSRALARTLLRAVDAFPYVVPYLLGALVARRSPARQRLGDRVAGTVVVDAASRRPSRPPARARASAPGSGWPPPMPPPPPPAPQEPPATSGPDPR